MVKLETLVYKLEFPKGIHLGDRKLSDAEMTLHADTLFSAFCHQAQEQEADGISKLCQLVQEGLRLSDAFPYNQADLFLPKPMVSLHKEDTDSSQKKLFKSIKYISVSDWDTYIKGEASPEALKDKLGQLEQTAVYTKIKHDLEGNHNIYNLGVRYFPAGTGLYFIIKCPSEATGYIDDLLYNLSFSGLGGKRKVGYGRFEVLEADDANSSRLKAYIDQDGPAYMSLSLGLPRADEAEVVTDALGYRVIRRGGFIADQLTLEARRKKDLFMLDAGSVFKRAYTGDLYDVSAGYPHPVYKYGLPIFMGVDL